jgi:hypothetical protein
MTDRVEFDQAVDVAVNSVTRCEAGPDGRHGIVFRATAARHMLLAMSLTPRDLRRLQQHIVWALVENLGVDIEAEEAAAVEDLVRQSEEFVRRHCRHPALQSELEESDKRFIVASLPQAGKLPLIFGRCRFNGNVQVVAQPAGICLEFLYQRVDERAAALHLRVRNAALLLRGIRRAFAYSDKNSEAGSHSPMSGLMSSVARSVPSQAVGTTP